MNILGRPLKDIKYIGSDDPTNYHRRRLHTAVFIFFSIESNGWINYLSDPYKILYRDMSIPFGNIANGVKEWDLI
jgi:hypothetical protein